MVLGLSQYLFTLLVVLLLTSVDYQAEPLAPTSKTSGPSWLRKPMTMRSERTPRQRRVISSNSSQLLSELVGAIRGDGKEDLSTQVLQKQLDRAEIIAEKLEVKIERLESENADLRGEVQDLRIMLAAADARQKLG